VRRAALTLWLVADVADIDAWMRRHAERDGWDLKKETR
jgi:hypothetical protein